MKNLKLIAGFLLLCALGGFLAGTASAQTKTEAEKELCFLGAKVAHDAYLQSTLNPQRVDPRLLHYSVDWWGDLQTTKHDRAAAHLAADHIAKRMKDAGFTRAFPDIVYELAREFMGKECLK